MSDKDKGFTYSKSASTNICLETPSTENPFLTEKRYLAGYDIEALTSKCSFIETLYLLFKQELPTQQQTQLLNALFVALCNAGPRDEAIRASMAAGVSKTRPEHLLPIGLNVVGGANNGAQTVERAYIFIQQQVHKARSPNGELDFNVLENELASLLAKFSDVKNIEPQLCIQTIPGFSQPYGSVDNLTARLTDRIFSIVPNSNIFIWCQAFNKKLNEYNLGISPIGLTAAVFLQLELGARESIGLYQLLRAPGILAQGMEQTHKPITSIPMLKDEDYHFTPKNGDIVNV
jgi:citrate synthase